MEGLETARQLGMIRAVGVSNFSVAQMEQLSEVGRIDACQVGYNLLWRSPERDVLPYCAEHGIEVIAYSALAHGILAGRYHRELAFAPDDQRWTISLFSKESWPQIYEIVEKFKQVAQLSAQPLAILALRWLLSRPAVTGVLVSTKSAAQARANARVLAAEVPGEVLDELTVLSERAAALVVGQDNPFGYHP